MHRCIESVGVACRGGDALFDRLKAIVRTPVVCRRRRDRAGHRPSLHALLDKLLANVETDAV